MEAVSYKLHDMACQCALIFPSHPASRTSFAERLRGGNFDGDAETAYWDPELLKHVKTDPIAEPGSGEAAAHARKVGGLAQHPHDLDYALRDHFAHCVLANRDVSKVYEAWMKAAEHRGPNSEAAKALAKQYGLVLDAAERSGVCQEYPSLPIVADSCYRKSLQCHFSCGRRGRMIDMRSRIAKGSAVGFRLRGRPSRLGGGALVQAQSLSLL